MENAKEDLSLSLDKEKELGQLKSRFISMASHEFRTPLTSVKLSASLIEKYAEPLASPNVSKHVNKIKQAVSNLTVILNDFLSLEKLEAGKEEVTIKLSSSGHWIENKTKISSTSIPGLKARSTWMKNC